MAVRVDEFTRDLGKRELPATILFAPGKPPWEKADFEPFLADEAIDAVVARYVDPALRDLTFTTYHADETEPGVVAEEARTLPFLAERRVILVRKADAYFAMNTEKRSPLIPLLNFIENPSSGTLLLLVAASPDKRKRLFKACDTHGLVVECPQKDDAALKTWIKERVGQREKSISPAAINTLIERVGSRLSDMNNAVNLVCNYAESATTITEEHVRGACADVAETTLWALTDAISNGKTELALVALHELLAANKSPEEILGIINWLLESAYRAMPETKTPLCKPFVQGKVEPLGRRLGREKVIAGLAMCTRTGFALRTTGVDRILQLEMMVIKLAAAAKTKTVAKRTPPRKSS